MLAILQVGHPWSQDSLAVMLREAGIPALQTSERVRDQLKNAGCDTIVDAQGTAEGWGGELEVPLPKAFEMDIRRRDAVLFDTKAHRNYTKIVKAFPNLAGRVCWYRINGGEPVDIEGKGPERDPPGPVLTPDLWYARTGPWSGRAYTFWPPYASAHRYLDHKRPESLDSPICLVNNLHGWGYEDVGLQLRREIGLRCYGTSGSPDGIISTKRLPEALCSAICYMHMKSVDAPGYALYEAILSGCPVVLPRRFISRTLTDALFVEGVSCLCFDKHTGDVDVRACVSEADRCYEALKDPVYNQLIARNAFNRLKRLIWNDAEGLKTWIRKMFPA